MDVRRELSWEAKLSFFCSAFASTLRYGRELRVVTARTRLTIQAAEMRFLRRVAGLSRCDKARSSATQGNLCIELLLLCIEGNQLRLFGLLARSPPDCFLLGGCSETTAWEEAPGQTLYIMEELDLSPS